MNSNDDIDLLVCFKLWLVCLSQYCGYGFHLIHPWNLGRLKFTSLLRYLFFITKIMKKPARTCWNVSSGILISGRRNYRTASRTLILDHIHTHSLYTSSQDLPQIKKIGSKLEKIWKKKKLKQHLKKLEKHTKSWKNSKTLEKSYKKLKNV